jgi:hypothetical protein
MFRNSVISRTGQTWKVCVAFAAMLVAGGGMVYAQWRIHSLSAEQFLLTMLGSVALAFTGLAFAFLFVRCPRCRARWFWMAVRTQPSATWLTWLTTLPRCPTCAHGEASDPFVERAG